MKPIFFATTSALLLAFSGTALAATFSFNGNTLGSTTFHRPTGDEFPSAPAEAELSSIGTEWSYQATSFTVDATGNYDITINSNVFDTYIALYSSFDANDPTSNLIALLDGVDGSLTSTYETLLSGINLQSGSNYTLVVTSFWENTNGDLDGNIPAGAFQATITGPGNINAVPEPSAALLGAIGALALLRRRRNA